jgi:hypothetical protein
MSTIHEEAAKSLLDRFMQSPTVAAELSATKNDLALGAFGERYTAWIGQTLFEPAYWPLEQVAAFLRVHSGIMQGEFALIEIGVGATPGKDADRRENADKLAKINGSFAATVNMRQNGATSDGHLRWEEPIWVEKSTGSFLLGPHDDDRPVTLAHQIRGGRSVPLEIGYTQPSATLLHLMTGNGGVARWAYGDERVCLMVNVERLTRRTRSHDLVATG